MQRDEVVAALRQAKKDRQEISRLQTRLAAFEKAWRGLSREEIIADYLLTAENMRERIAGYVKRNPHWDIVVLTPQRWYMEQLLDGLAERGWA